MPSKIYYFLSFCIITLLMFSCDESNYVFTPEETTETDNTDTSCFSATISEAMEANDESHEDDGDYLWEESEVKEIVLNGSSITAGIDGITISGSVITITSAGTYRITGTLDNGQVVVNSTGDGTVRIIFNGMYITNLSSSPFNAVSADKLVIILAEGTDNYLTDGSSYVFASADEDEPNASLFSKADLTISGTGNLTIQGNYRDGISSKDGLIIKSGNITVNAADDGIRGKDYLIIENGNISVIAGGDGLKSDNDEDSTRGYIFIQSGQITITSGADAISAKTDLLISGGEFYLETGGGSSVTVDESSSAKAIKGLINTIIDQGTFSIDAADDAIHSNGNIVIAGGSFSCSSADDGIHAESKISLSNCTITIDKSVEGIEGPDITVNSGTIRITASDDGFNATTGKGGEANDGSSLQLKGGYVVVSVSRGDGFDSNGSISISGGTHLVHGPQSQPEVGMDYNGTCNISGGFLIITGPGSNMTQGPSTSSTQYSLKLIMTTSSPAGTLFHIESEDGENVVTFQPARSYSSVILSSPLFENGSSYRIYTGGTSTGTNNDGLITDGEYSSGNKYTDFTISGMVTSIGNISGPGNW